VLAWFTHHGGDLVATSARLGNGRPPGPTTCAQNHNLAHTGTSPLPAGPNRRPPPTTVSSGVVSDRIPTTVDTVNAPLDPDMFDPVCPSDLSPIRIGDKWAGMIIRCLEHGPRRFSELRIPLRGITAKALTKSLRALERDGLIQRTTHLDRARRVEYDLTPLGRSLLEPMAAVCTWAQDHWGELLDAREASTPLQRAG
jgi:DNA-binding HxlR family transcriptional regulator